MKAHKRNPNWLSLLLVATITAFMDPTFAQTTTAAAAYVPAEKIFLNCGASSKGNQTSQDGQGWEADSGSGYAAGIQKTVSATPSAQDPSIPTVPYMTARIFQTPYTYSFPVTPGRKFVRLHFYPSNFTDPKFVASDSFFSVSVGPYTLLNNFSALLTAQAADHNYVIKEFSVNISSNTLNLMFTPSPANEKAFAFVNGIEIVTMPQIFVQDDVFRQPLIVGRTSTLTIDEHMALETVARLNVGGQSVSPVDDSGLYREWDDDSIYIYGAAVGVTYPKDPNVTIKYPDTVPEYIAPPLVYGTARSMGPNAFGNLNYNLTWIVTVDAGFYYLVRLHFCEIAYPVTKVNMRVFDVFINNMTAVQGFDVIAYTNQVGLGVPIYLDFIVFFPNTSASSQQDIWVSLHPHIDSKPVYYDAELNGLEIFKLNDSTGNLAGPNPSMKLIVYQGKQEGDQKNHDRHFFTIEIGVPAAVLFILLLAFMELRRLRQGKMMLQSCVSSPSHESRLFSVSGIKTATKDFSKSLVTGVGGFGKVSRGEIDGTGDLSLIGYCNEDDEMILVYDYMVNRTLRYHLYHTQNPPLSWKQRLETKAARGFHYLHTGAKPSIIHCNVKTTNILLEDKWIAKVSDFGQSKADRSWIAPTSIASGRETPTTNIPLDDKWVTNVLDLGLSKATPELDCTHVSTNVKGSFGYLDPEYFWNQKLMETSDFYSFGVVLFEVLCRQPAMDRSLLEEQVSLANWALHCKRNSTIDQIIDPNLKDDVSPDSLEKFVEIAERCLTGQGIERPSMGDVLWNLEVALHLQDPVFR